MIKQLAAIAAVSTCLAVTTVHAAQVNVCVAASMTEDACPLSETVVVVINHVGNTIRLDKPFKNVQIGANFVDIQVRTDHRFILNGVSPGRTNVVFYDDDDKLIKNLDVIVKADPGRVRVFNRPMSGSTVFNCTPAGCEFVSMSKYEKPAENVNINQTGGSAPAPVVVVPRQ
jgi:Flp pilus assembly secretin CpaC